MTKKPFCSLQTFELVEYFFVISILRAFGFGPDFIQWVKTFFKNVESRVMNKGRSTAEAPDKETLSLKYLFILALEVLLIQIRENAYVKGIFFND